jgi:hypothetical protein
MALTTTISQKELARVAALAYEGRTIKVMLCSVGTTGFTSNSTAAEWQSAEISGNGYARHTEVLAEGAYDVTDARYEVPSIDAEFSSSGLGYSYDRIVIYIDGETYIHSLITESPNIALAPGQTQTYRISIATDD